jgi:hypothetical protein
LTIKDVTRDRDISATDKVVRNPNWSLPRPLVIPKVMTLKKLETCGN